MKKSDSRNDAVGVGAAPEPSLRVRYLAKIIANISGAGIQFLVQVIVPRALGPVQYGNFSFLTNFFTQVVSFFDMGTSAGFFTKLSQRPKDKKLVLFYLIYCSAVVVAISASILIIPFGGIRRIFWPGQEGLFICLAAVWAGLTWASQVLVRMNDAWGLTVSSELTQVLYRAIGCVIFLVLAWLHHLNLVSLFIGQIVALGVLCVGLVWIPLRLGWLDLDSWMLGRKDLKCYFAELLGYAQPLIVYCLVGAASGVFDRWILQVYGGSIEQGFFGLASQIGAACFLVGGAMTPLIHREFSIAFERQDRVAMARVFRRAIPLLYAFVAFFACFVATHARAIAILFGGERFVGAGTILAVMAFAPIHQTYGQLSGTLFYATGATVLYRNIGIIFLILGIPITFLMVAPSSHFGLDAGALGLAVKVIAIQFLWVNVQLYFNARYLRLPFWKYFVHQLVTIVVFLTLSYLSNRAVITLNITGPDGALLLVVSGLLYALVTVGAVFCIPQLFALQRQDLFFIREKLKGRMT